MHLTLEAWHNEFGIDAHDWAGHEIIAKALIKKGSFVIVATGANATIKRWDWLVGRANRDNSAEHMRKSVGICIDSGAENVELGRLNYKNIFYYCDPPVSRLSSPEIDTAIRRCDLLFLGEPHTDPIDTLAEFSACYNKLPIGCLIAVKHAVVLESFFRKMNLVQRAGGDISLWAKP